LRRFLPLSCLLLCFAASAPAADDLRERIARQAAQVASIQAELVQEKHLSVFQEVIRSTGRFAYARPDRLRWELLKPVKTGFVLRGATGERWHDMIEGRESFSIERDPVMKAVSEQLFAWAAADFARLDSQYEITTLAPAPPRFRLIPRSPALKGQIESIEVSFSADERYVEEVVVREKGGDFTRLDFKDVRLNAALPAGTF
jgi:outer membrane lipoprotein-sorting protein